MHLRKILVTGGAGFVGSSLAIRLARENPECVVTAFDNLKRRGSELALPRLKQNNVAFLHGDVRNPEDLAVAGSVDLMIDCAAEPSVQAGYGGSPQYLINTNLVGMIDCLAHLRRTGGAMLFLSTSRIYPIAALRALPFDQSRDGVALPAGGQGVGWSDHGIAEDFPLGGARSMYGATKLSSELLIEEYRAMYGMQAAILRSGVIAGPWQMGKVDQGFTVLWLARHVFNGALSYTGFGGAGGQVRDILHIDDLCDLTQMIATNLSFYDGTLFNIGGGIANSVSLRGLTDRCYALTGQKISIDAKMETSQFDIPYYVSDNRKIEHATGWAPKRRLDTVLDDIHMWLRDNHDLLQPILG